jgi:hypothetical protein
MPSISTCVIVLRNIHLRGNINRHFLDRQLVSHAIDERHNTVRAHMNSLLPLAAILALASCGGSGIPDILKSINIDRMECPIASDGATIPPGTNSQVKAYATIIGIKYSDVVWSWDADNPAVLLGAQSQTDNTSTRDVTAPNFSAKYKINVHAEAEGKRGDATCELEVK